VEVEGKKRKLLGWGRGWGIGKGRMKLWIFG